MDSSVKDYYNGRGWEDSGGFTHDALKFEDLRECAREYVSKCRRRVTQHIPESGDRILDMASGPLQYSEYLEYSKGFNYRYCVDLSKKALDSAAEKIGSHGVYYHGDFLTLDFPNDFFDCAISLHTIYHIPDAAQFDVVMKLLNVTKPQGKVIIVASNRRSIVEIIKSTTIGVALKKIINSYFKCRSATSDQDVGLYFFPQSIEWWDQFSSFAEINIYPWRSFNSNTQKIVVPDNKFGFFIFKMLYRAEDLFPKFFAKYFQYPMIVLTKK